MNLEPRSFLGPSGCRQVGGSKETAARSAQDALCPHAPMLRGGECHLEIAHEIGVQLYNNVSMQLLMPGAQPS